MAFDLGAMLRDVSEPDTGMERIEYIPLDLIDSDPNNFYQLTEIEKLADNISLCGLQQPIRVRQQDGGRYMIVSGHRRRAALEMLVADGYDIFSKAACIVERDEVSPALQQLRLIYANAGTRKLTPAEISEQAVQVEKLLYQLKDEGYDFPGRMRDHVAEAVGASKTKLARLKVIRENLAECWKPFWSKNILSESTAYELAQLTEANQQIIFDSRKSDDARGGIYSSIVECYAERFKGIEKIKCKKEKNHLCSNCDRKKKKAASIDRWTYFHCNKCCSTCSQLASCKYACPKLADMVKKLRSENKEKRQADKRAQEKRDKPTIDLISNIYSRLGEARSAAKVSVPELFDAQGRYRSVKDMEELEALESGTAKVTPQTNLPFGYSLQPCSVERIIKVADLLGCSIDYLFGRTDCPDLAKSVVSEPDTGWKTGDPWNFGEYVVLVRYDSAKAPTPEKMLWTEDGWDMFGSPFDDICPDVDIIGWMPMPEEE